MPPFMFSVWPRKCSNSSDEENQNDSEESCVSAHALEEIKAADRTPANRISWPSGPVDCRRKLVHAFSDVNQFDIDLKTEMVQPKELRADFVHLHGVGVHPNATNCLHHEDKEGFRFRSIKRSMSSLASVHSARRPDTKTVVVVPSIDLDAKELKRMCNCIEYYEERQLYHLLLANDPSLRIIYLTSNCVSERIVRYYLGLGMGADDPSMADKLSRVFVISVPSTQYISLSQKILEDKNLIQFVKTLIHQRKAPSITDSAGLSVFTGSDAADKLSRELGIRLLESSGSTLHWGTKQGSREVFAAVDVPHPPGTPSIDDDDLLTFGKGDEVADWSHCHRYIRSSRDLAIGMARQILAHGVHPRRWVVKLNQGFSGKGNASIDLRRLQEEFASSQNAEEDVLHLAAKIENEFESALKFEDNAMTWKGDREHPGFQTQIERLGVIAEAFIEGEVPTSPSFQAVIEPGHYDGAGGTVSIVSTHEQLLQGQVYMGCINPCSENYRGAVMQLGLKVGQYLAARGVVGHFSCDFLATQAPDHTWILNAIEINLRQGGTTHPHAAMSLLCGGCISTDGVFRTNDNEARTYIATDNQSMKPCSESRLIDAIESSTSPLARQIRWNSEERVGVVFHLFKFCTLGRIGFTAIGRSAKESQFLFDKTKEFLSQLN